MQYWRAPYRFLVLDTPSGPILGSDFSSDHGMIVDLRSRTLSWIGGLLDLGRPMVEMQCCCLVMEAAVENTGMHCIIIHTIDIQTRNRQIRKIHRQGKRRGSERKGADSQFSGVADIGGI